MLDARVAQRFNWPWTVIDMQDEGRTVRAMMLLNVADAYSRVMSALEQHALSSIGGQDWELYKLVEDARAEEKQ